MPDATIVDPAKSLHDPSPSSLVHSPLGKFTPLEACKAPVDMADWHELNAN